MTRTPAKRPSQATMRVRLELHPLSAAYDQVIASPAPETFKRFCRMYRTTLLIWLRLDRGTPGKFDGSAKLLVQMGDAVLKLMSGLCGSHYTGEQVSVAIERHRRDFVARLEISPKLRALADEAIVVQAKLWPPAHAIHKLHDEERIPRFHRSRRSQRWADARGRGPRG